MSFVLSEIDFDTRSVSFEITSGTDSEPIDRLADCLGYCRALGYERLQICYPGSTGAGTLTELQELSEIPGTTLTPIHQSHGNTMDKPPIQSSHFECATSRTSETETFAEIEYKLSCRDLASALRVVSHYVLLVGHSIPLETRFLTRLRLCVYELTANSVEHATFNPEDPEIRVGLRVGVDTIEVTYKDNAVPFATTASSDVTIQDKVETKAKRGLGLFLIRKTAKNMVFRRIGRWNCTKFTLEWKRNIELHT